jgi:exodeoxyribonuclease VII small subunit
LNNRTSEPDPQTGGDSSQVPSFEAALVQLETIVHQLEDGEIGLAEALNRYETGVTLLKQCYALLEKAERRIELLCGFDAQGNPVTQPLDDAPSFAEDPTASTRKARRSSAGSKPSRRPAPVEDDPRSSSTQIDNPGGLF